MNRALTLTALTGSLLIGAQSFAAESNSTMSKRQFATQVIGCMRKKMAIDKHMSYNEAVKTCKAQVSPGEGAQGTLVASDTALK